MLNDGLVYSPAWISFAVSSTIERMEYKRQPAGCGGQLVSLPSTPTGMTSNIRFRNLALKSTPLRSSSAGKVVVMGLPKPFTGK